MSPNVRKLAMLTIVVLATACAEAPTSSKEPAAAADPRAPKEDRAAGATPEETVRRFIEAHRQGDNEELRVIIHPASSPYRVEGPVPIPEYEIRSKRVLTQEEASALKGSPPRQAGDVEIRTWEVYAGGRTSLNEYYLREFPEGWKIIALAFEI